jgi:hypothetical protein
MKIDYGKILAYWLLLIWSIITVLWLTGCSANYHLNKFQNKGGICGKIDTIRITTWDTVTNSYYFRDSLVIVNDRVVPLTRTEIRYLDRVRHDTLKHKETLIKYITKQEKEKTKQVKAENKTPWKFIIGALIGILGFFAFFLLINRVKRYIN